MLDIRHQLPGRLRLHLPALRSDAALARHMERELRRCEGIRAVRSNAICASLVVIHEPKLICAAVLQQRVADVLQAAPTRGGTRVVAANPTGLTRVPASAHRAEGGWLQLPSRMITNARHQLRNWQDGRATPRAAQEQAPVSGPSAPWKRTSVDRLGGVARRIGSTSPLVAMLCRVNLRISRWMLRQTVKCWWNGELGPILGPSDLGSRKPGQSSPVRSLMMLKSSPVR